MRPGDLREVVKQRAWGECYCCRRIYLLTDLAPVSSSDPDDWRYICPLCRTVAAAPDRRRAIRDLSLRSSKT